MTEEEILLQIRLSPDPVVTAGELAERTDYSRQNINIRLEELVENGLVAEKKAGARAKVYWLTDDGVQRVSELG